MTNDAFRTLMEKSDMLKRSDLLQLLQMSVKVNSMLNKVINKQKDQCNKNVKGTPSGVPSEEPNCFENKSENNDEDETEEEKSGCTIIPLRGERQRDAGLDISESTPTQQYAHRACAGGISESTSIQQYAEKSKEIDSANQDIGKTDLDTKVIPSNQCTKK